ncbi:hypothetical protein PIB30_076662 [Stylosanthes scabra]|uniref:Ubiquitin-like protease family profile domain-containing protein n=1 Tax=Stylosanthes scabra TaxID=79078 RepID=A0ABU6QR61_9FABA|nr:hypothetical protein [Stylosanthes scabra]
MLLQLRSKLKFKLARKLKMRLLKLNLIIKLLLKLIREKPPQTHATEEEEDDFDRPSFDLGIGTPPIKKQEPVKKQAPVEICDMDEFPDDEDPKTPAVPVSQTQEARQCEITEDLEKRCVIWALNVKGNNKYEIIFKLRGDLYYEAVSYDCGIFVMKYMELIDPKKLDAKKAYHIESWTTEELQQFRDKYISRMLFSEENLL